jgi:PPM family protein phosphatase
MALNLYPFESKLDIGVQTDVGMRRDENQDALALSPSTDQAAWQQQGHLFLVADGMGAHAAGELASEIAVTEIPKTYVKRIESKGLSTSPYAILRESLEEANRQIFDQGAAKPQQYGMGTTCSALALLPCGAIIAHVGDSRVYRWRDNQFEQLTFDHSLVWELMARSPNRAINEEVPRNIITRSLGPRQYVQVDMEGPFEIRPGDHYLLCSDGLTNAVQDTEIGIILGSLGAQEAAQTLVDLANYRGGPDNITVLAVNINEDEQPETATETTGSDPEIVKPVKPQLRPKTARSYWLAVLLTGLVSIGLYIAGLVFSTTINFFHMAILGGILTFGLAITALGKNRPVNTENRPAPFIHEGPPLGKGPYRVWEAKADGSFVERLGTIVEHLRTEALTFDRQVDWGEIDAALASAQRNIFSCKYAKATKNFCKALRLLSQRSPDKRPK